MTSANNNNNNNNLQRFLKWWVLPCLVAFSVGGVLSEILQSGSGSDAAMHHNSVDHDDALRDHRETLEKKPPQQGDYLEEENNNKQNSDHHDGSCWDRFWTSLDAHEQEAARELLALEDSHGDGIPVLLHHNGDVQDCGNAMDVLSQLRQTLMTLQEEECPNVFDKYQVESILTRAFHQAMPTCSSEEFDRLEEEGFFGYCDMGDDKTPILMDHDQLVPISLSKNNGTTTTYLPCHFHTREGVRLTSFSALVSLLHKEHQRTEEHDCQENNQDDQQTCLPPNNNNNNKEIHLYAVPAGRVFMFAPAYVGEIFDLPHIQGADPTKPVYMQVISTSPRVFDIFNFFTKEESAGLVEKAIAEQSETHRMKRSSTGASGYNINSRRTSENGFDTHGKTAQEVKRRCFDVLGFDEYIEGHSDGLQILRYNQTKAYTAHLDWIDDDGKTQEHNFDSAGKGGNRYATILLYMADLEEGEGGETVFHHGKPLDENAPDYRTAMKELRNSKEGALFRRNSWEEQMVATCRSSLAVRPNSARAVLFYSQLPNGAADPASLHGGCPVVSDKPKWAANLWVWNTPRGGFPGAPVNQDVVDRNRRNGSAPSVAEPAKKIAKFTNDGGDPAFEDAELFYEDVFWGKFSATDEHRVNTFEGQVWNVKNKSGHILKTWTIGSEAQQTYTV